MPLIWLKRLRAAT